MPACPRLTSVTRRWNPARSAALAPDCPRSLSMTTTRSMGQPRATARSRSAYCRVVLSVFSNTCRRVDCRTYKYAVRDKWDAVILCETSLDRSGGGHAAPPSRPHDAGVPPRGDRTALSTGAASSRVISGCCATGRISGGSDDAPRPSVARRIAPPSKHASDDGVPPWRLRPRGRRRHRATRGALAGGAPPARRRGRASGLSPAAPPRW